MGPSFPLSFFFTSIEEHWNSIEEIEGTLKLNTGLHYIRRTIPDSTDSRPEFNGFQSRIQRIPVPDSTDKLRKSDFWVGIGYILNSIDNYTPGFGHSRQIPTEASGSYCRQWMVATHRP